MKPPGNSALTLIEVIVLIAIMGVFMLVAIPAQATSLVRGQMTQGFSNLRMLHLVAQQMALDGMTTGDTTLGWPGDIGGTFTNWTAQIVPSYLNTNDLCKLLSAPGIIVKPNKLPHMSDTAVLIYAIRSNSPDTAVFASSANFTNTPTGGAPIDPANQLWDGKGFIVFHKSGDGAILLPKQTGNTNIVGTFVPLCR